MPDSDSSAHQRSNTGRTILAAVSRNCLAEFITRNRVTGLGHDMNGIRKRRTNHDGSRKVSPSVSSTSNSNSSTSAASSWLSKDQSRDALGLIAGSNRTSFEKRVWTALCQIPRGCVTTYGLLSAHVGSSPRAVGNALRRNPFAPDVPCHRVVATGMTLGGFKGRWPREGEGITLDEKRRLLKSEGVRFDDKGRVLGTVWKGWT
ncbi:hypothetical protein CDD80_457 [Ophiocordyceps camponoti-rufipedis]|uniref:Methylated-DNA--protein-cysteine methyltransferase n=1 Tax=Ophiocordyceps camponoti-rufipedis TaxID=2004952 RepID=A0A2C5ZEF7_9HYPO|nr:hypothetical protein CDD80_457 [Ophiocordyceps camponoti-rufipedis]